MLGETNYKVNAKIGIRRPKDLWIELLSMYDAQDELLGGSCSIWDDSWVLKTFIGRKGYFWHTEPLEHGH